jgi:hypothetical protein
MPPKGTTKKQKRQYEHIKESAKKSGQSTDRAQEIAAATVNKQKSKKKGGKKKGGAKRKGGKKKGGGRKKG